MTKHEAYLKRPEWIAFIAALVGGGTHLFGLVHVLHNHDNLAVQPAGFGTGLTSGRWFLEILARIVNILFGNYNLPFINGLLFLALLAISSGLLVSVLHLKSRKAAALIGVLFVVFPSVASTMFYRYTVFYYGVAILLSILAVSVLERNKRYGLLLSAFCTALSLGIYQAYPPITISLFVLLLIQQALQDESSPRKLVRRGLYYCAALLLGLVLYYLLLQFFLFVFDKNLNSYQGINKMGQLSIGQIPELIKDATVSFIKLPVKDYCDLAQTPLLKCSYLLLGLLSIALIAYILIVKIKKIYAVIFAILLCMLFPLAVNFIVIMCPSSDINTMMVYSFVLVLCVPFVLLEALPPLETLKSQRIKGFVANVVGLLTAAIIINYAVLENVNYTALYYANQQTINYMNSIVVQIRMTEGFDAEKTWAFIGKIDDPLIYSKWQNVPTYRGNSTMKNLVNVYSRDNWFSVHTGYSIPWADSTVVETLSASKDVIAMPCWPAEGSIKIIGDTVVVKFQEISS